MKMKYLIVVLLCFCCSSCGSVSKCSITRYPIVTDDYIYSVVDVAYANQKIEECILDKKYGNLQVYIVPKTICYDVIIVQFDDKMKVSRDLIKLIGEDARQFLNESRKSRIKMQDGKTEAPE